MSATKYGLEFFKADNVLFASDSPFDPEKGSGYIRDTIKIRLCTKPRKPAKINTNLQEMNNSNL